MTDLHSVLKTGKSISIENFVMCMIIWIIITGDLLIVYFKFIWLIYVKLEWKPGRHTHHTQINWYQANIV